MARGMYDPPASRSQPESSAERPGVGEKGPLNQPTPPDPDTTVEAPLAYRVVRGGLWLAIGSYWNIAVGFAATLVLTRLLDPASFGVYALAAFFFSIFNLRGKLGIATALEQRRTLDGQALGSHLGLDVGSGVLSLLIAVVASVVLVLLGYSVDVGYVVVALAGIGMLDSVATTAASALTRELRFRSLSLVTGVAFPLSYLPGLYLAFHGAGYWSLVAQGAVYSLLTLVGVWRSAARHGGVAWHSPWSFSVETARELLRFGLPVGAPGYLAVLTLQFDSFLIGTFAGETVLGFYNRAYRIAQWPSQLISTVIARVAFQAYARLQDDRDRLRTALEMTIWLTTSTALPLAVATFAAAPDIVLLLFGEEWLPSVPFVRLLVVYSALRPLLETMTALMTGAGRPGAAGSVLAVQAVTLVLAGLALTVVAGAIGTAIAVGVSFAVGAVVAFWLVRRIVSVNVVSEVMIPLAAAGIALAIHLGVVRLLDLNDLILPLRVIIKLGYAGAAYFAALLVLQPVRLLHRVQHLQRLVLQRET